MGGFGFIYTGLIHAGPISIIFYSHKPESFISDLYTDDSKDRNKVAAAVIDIKWHILSKVSRCGINIYSLIKLKQLN